MYLKSISMTLIAFLFLTILIFMFMYKRKKEEMIGKFFFSLLICTIVVLFLELINPLTIMYRIKYSLINEIISKLYFCSLITWIVLFTIYIDVLIFNNKHISKKSISNPLIIGLVFNILSFVYIFINEIEYKGGINNIPYVAAGMNLYFIYLVYFIGTIYILFLLNIYRKKVENINLIPTMLILLFFIILLLIQIFYNYEINELSTYCVLIITISYFTVESQDFKMLSSFKESKKIAEKVNESKTLFLMKISHEIRTPMNIIIGYSQALLNDKDLSRETIIKDIENITEACSTLTELIDAIIEMSKLEKGESFIKEDSYFLENIIFEINSVVPPKITEKNVSLMIDVNPNLPKEYIGDAFKIFKVIEYMVLNAIKYTSYGEIKLYFDGIKKEDNSYDLNITISCLASSLMIENYNINFEDFINNSISNETSLDNVILGVIISKELINKLNGKIEFIKKDQLTKCCITINQKSNNSTLIGNIFNKIDINHDEELINLNGKNILVVDDGDINLVMTKKSLKNFNANVTTASSGKECIELVKKHNYDLIFLDQYMPEMDGISTMNSLSLLERDIPPVVALTANTYDSLKDDYTRYGFSDYLHKPIILKELNRILKKYFDKTE